MPTHIHSSPSSILIFFSVSCQRARRNLQRPSKVKLFITLKMRRLTPKFQKAKTKTDFRHFYVCAYVLCPTLSDHVDCSLPGSPVHGILQATTLEWTAISFSRGSSQSRDWTHISCICRQILFHLSHQGSPLLESEVDILKNNMRLKCSTLWIIEMFWYLHCVKFYSLLILFSFFKNVDQLLVT